ncbi:MAG TPA: sigma-70 family RNA polymerase sigma factor [Gemmatimonadales bacterium]|nr:sigma-70 family RNA polymerase sigma factor [Gemmatimonadales bacterium]
MEPWLATLEAGDPERAWNLFHARYRPLILATIRRLVADADEVMDHFGAACQLLIADDFARLRRYAAQGQNRESAASWVVLVVRNQVVDALRHEHGRERRRPPPGLTEGQQELWELLCPRGHSPAEAYELLRARHGEVAPFHQFLREVRALREVAPCPDRVRLRPAPVAADLPDHTPDASERAEAAESADQVERALAALAPDLRLAITLFIVDGLPAARVARLVGWPGAKTVYNRVSRALARLREDLERGGIGPEGLR